MGTRSTTEVGTTELPNICGDGELGGSEQCDDGNLLPDDGCSPICEFDPHLVVFVSSASYLGSKLNGALQADAKCVVLAEAQPALAGRKFVAWLSSDVSNAKDRIGSSQLPYRRLDAVRTIVAKDTAALLGGTLAAPIDFTEFGVVAKAPQLAWTGTTTAGVATAEHCSNWDVDALMGTLGGITATDATWTVADTGSCIAQRRLYCIETTL